jgi:hypothetical protein
MFRQDKEEESAHFIMSTLIKDEKPMTLKIQKELKAGRPLGKTSAGAVIIEEMAGMMKKCDEELQALWEEMEEAKRENNEVLRAEIAEERRKLEEMKARAEEDMKRLETMRMPRQEGSRAAVEIPTTVDSQRPSNIRDHRYSKDPVGSKARATTADKRTWPLCIMARWQIGYRC